MHPSKSRRPRKYPAPTKEQFRIIRGHADLSEIFTSGELAEKGWLAERRIVAVFHHAQEWRDGKFRKTDNYILGVAGKQSALARHINEHIRRNFVSTEDLPAGMGRLWPKYIQDAVENLQYRIILATLNKMCAPRGADIWYDETYGIWQSSQSCHDRVQAESKVARKIYKFDRRNWHGRPREQARRRGTPPGASISYPPR